MKFDSEQKRKNHLRGFNKVLGKYCSLFQGGFVTPEPRLDIFFGANEEDAIWKACVEGLENARKRMEELAARVPGKYFVFASYSHSILAKIDTTMIATNADTDARNQQSA